MNILLACNAGMSTSLLVQKMRQEAEAEQFADGKPVIVIPMSDYGRMNAKGIIAEAVAALEA